MYVFIYIYVYVYVCVYIIVYVYMCVYINVIAEPLRLPLLYSAPNLLVLLRDARSTARVAPSAGRTLPIDATLHSALQPRGDSLDGTRATLAALFPNRRFVFLSLSIYIYIYIYIVYI